MEVTELEEISEKRAVNCVKSKKAKKCQVCRKHHTKYRRECPECKLLVAPSCYPEKCWNDSEGLCKHCYQDRIERSSNRVRSRKRENHPIYEWFDPNRDRESGIERLVKEAVEAKVLHDMHEVVGNAPLPVVAEVTSRLFTKLL